jgi:hypothetical protein
MGTSILMCVAALYAALLRLGWNLPPLQLDLALGHGPLMVCGFLGTLICLERAVALQRGWAFAAPLLTACGSALLVVGIWTSLGALFITIGSAFLVAVFIAIVRRQPAMFTVTMALGALAWLIGNALWTAGIAIPRMVHWWAGFLVLTIVGERLELSRLASISRRGKILFACSAGIYLLGLGVASFSLAQGSKLAGVGMLALTLWLGRFDIIRFTIRSKGLPRFIAVCLAGGYFWLAIAGLLWLLVGSHSPVALTALIHYDAVVHSVFLGFVFSMIFAHAPIIFPALTGRPMRYQPIFYVHVVLLHISLAWRVGGDLLGSFFAYYWSGALNIVALLLFLVISGSRFLSAAYAGKQTG